MRVFLVNSDNDHGIGANANGRSFPPLGIVSLGTVLKNRFADRIELTLLDGQISHNQKIIECTERDKPNFVGISLYNTSTRNAASLIHAAKGVGAITMIGNDHAIAHHDLWLRTLHDLDYVCLNDIGEE
jgi:anaerobic magnesium-protoporphyrin IX monomethyl ester cyclase